jgi:hypothetical protein
MGGNQRMMTETKTPPRCTTTGTAKKQSIAKSSNCIVSLKRAAVKLAITADLVLLLAALGSLNVPTIVGSTLALNALCGLILKQEENIHENV